jgi:hypothetical protein
MLRPQDHADIGKEPCHERSTETLDVREVGSCSDSVSPRCGLGGNADRGEWMRSGTAPSSPRARCRCGNPGRWR